MARLVRSHWWAPSIMGLSFLVGLLLALGHHLFYQSLMDRPTSHTTDYRVLGAHLQGQQLNIAIGTAFAFVVKAAFVLAVSIAYYQIFWKYVKTDSEENNLPTLGRLDVAFSALNDIISMFTAPVWLHYPLLFLMAATAWLIPLASIITPATLSVVLKEDVISTSPQNVPRIDFSRFAFLGDMPGHNSESTADVAKSWDFRYDGPSQTLQRAALSVAVRNEVLPVDASFLTTNTTWISEFHGPSLNCGPVDHNQTTRIQQNIANYLLNECLYPPTYLAWYPRYWQEYGDRLYHEPYFSPCSYTNDTRGWPCFGQKNAASDVNWFLSEMSRDGETPEAMFYVALMPNVLREWDDILNTCESSWYNLTILAPAVNNDMTLMKCEMHNSTYRARFNYTSTAHDIQFEVTERGPKAPMTFDAIPLKYLSTEESTSNCTNPGVGQYGTSEQKKKVQRCVYDPAHIPQFVYQSILEAFTHWITGNLTYGTGEVGTENIISGSSQIRKTTLFDTKDMHYLTTAGLTEKLTDNLNFANLQSTIMSSTADLPITSDISLSDAIEKMFNNFTISLLNAPQFRMNYSSPTAPPQTEVTTISSQTVYTYRADRLWAAYGTAAFCTAISVLLGIFAILASRDTFRNTFSTIFRLGRAADLSVEIHEKDLNGMTPLPAYLAAATVRFSKRGTGERSQDLVTGEEGGFQKPLLDDEETRKSR
ncbi:hypothetical protein N0V90_012444 [Kalmusia sp. IMI 367209]|nr:hypothetical protein N0V90_012444 [Kalmusia sp. IMI 367209]